MKNKQKYYQFMLDFHYLLSPHYPSKEIMIEMVAESHELLYNVLPNVTRWRDKGRGLCVRRRVLALTPTPTDYDDLLQKQNLTVHIVTIQFKITVL